MSVYCECCVLSGRGLCDELITRPEESYQVCGVCFIECTQVQQQPSTLTTIRQKRGHTKKEIKRVSILGS
jgi:hypothetical protein